MSASSGEMRGATSEGEATGLFRLAVLAVLAWGAWLVFDFVRDTNDQIRDVTRLPAEVGSGIKDTIEDTHEDVVSRPIREIQDGVKDVAGGIEDAHEDFVSRPVRDASSGIGKTLNDAKTAVEDAHETFVSKPIRDAQDRLGGFF